uniref:Uncharacterized protein n=1 Tax=Picea sitchensis TaxID=3332 RepID=A9NW86_PICSI|nr:unknown [Picea sitchensis]
MCVEHLDWAMEEMGSIIVSHAAHNPRTSLSRQWRTMGCCLMVSTTTLIEGKCHKALQFCPRPKSTCKPKLKC